MPINTTEEKFRGIPLTDEVWAKLDKRAQRNDRTASREAAAIIKAALGSAEDGCAPDGEIRT